MKKKKENNRFLTLRLQKNLHEAVQAQAAKEERSVGSLVRYALRLYLENAK